MVVMLVDVVPPALRGELSRWLMPVDSTVFVGRVSAEVRALLWDAAVAKAGDGRVVQIWRTHGEQGFAMRTHNLRDRHLVAVDGLQFMAVRDAAWAEAAERFKLRPPA